MLVSRGGDISLIHIRLCGVITRGATKLSTYYKTIGLGEISQCSAQFTAERIVERAKSIRTYVGCWP